MKELKAILVTSLMIAMSFMALPWGMPQAGATTITTFGNGATEVTVAFAGANGGTDTSTDIALPKDAYVTSATFTVNGQPHTAGGKDYPRNVSVDVGADSTVDWAWDSAKNGPLGLQDGFTDGNKTLSYNFKGPWVDYNHTLRLPTDIKLTKATFNVSGGNVQYFEEKLYYGHQWDFMGFSSTGCGDLNGDGIPDFVAAGPHTGWGMWNNGRLDVFFGGKKVPDKPDLEIMAPVSDEAFGWALACGGDVNGDGYNDIIVGAPYWTNATLYDAGAAYIYYGGPSMLTTPSVTLRGTEDDDEFGFSVANLGDVTGDGYADVLVGAPYNATVNGYNRGAAYLYTGGKPMSTTPAYVYYGSQDWEELGTFVANVSDVNHDKHGDYVIGAPGNGNGAVYVFYGGTSIKMLQDLTIKPADGSSFGEWGAGVGDLNGDGFDDIGVQNQFNEVLIYYGGTLVDGTWDVKLTGEGVWDYFGIAISSLHDLNGDGYDELLVGASQYNNSKDEVGKAYLYYGGAPMGDKPAYTWQGIHQGDEYGASLADIGDFSDSGAPAFVLGEDGNDSYAINAGTLHVLMWINGIQDPRVDLGSGPLNVWNWTNYFHGTASSGNVMGKVALALNGSAPSYTDRYGTRFTNMTFLVNVNSKGDLQVKDLSIEYELKTNLSDLSKVLNNYMATHSALADTKFHIPIKITTTSAGDVKLSGLKVTYAHMPVGIPLTGLRIAQGTSDFHYLDLFMIFSDPDDVGANLTFNVTGNTNASYIWAGVKDGHYLALDAMNHSKNINWSGTTQVNMTAKDDDNHVSRSVAIMIDVYRVPHAPFITSNPVLEAREGGTYQYQVSAVDADGDSITFSLGAAPRSMAIDATTGLIKWYPAVSDVGNRTVTVEASDGKLKGDQTFVIKVGFKLTPGNHLPYITSTPPTKVTVGYKYDYKIAAYDDDYNTLHYGIDKGPQNMTVNGTSGQVLWQPVMVDVGVHLVRVNVSDGKDRIFQEWTINVTSDGLNHLPVINGIPPAKAYVGLEFIFNFNGYDEDGDQVTFWLDSGPKGMTMSSAGTMSWTPGNSYVGAHTYTVEATDGKGFTYKAFTVDVTINHMPTVRSYPLQDATVGKQYKYVMSVEDLDPTDFVLVELVSGPTGMKLDNKTRTLKWTPTDDQKGPQTVSIRITDGKQSDYQNVTIKVKGPTQTLWDQAGMVIILAILVAVICTIVGVFAYMRYKKRKAEAETVIEDVFLIYRDGRLISHNTRRLKPEQDEHTMTAMLTAIQEFVKDSIPTEGEGQKPIEEISFGKDKILLSHGKLVYIAAVITGTESEGLRARMSDSIRKIETDFAEILKKWDGDLRDVDGARRVMKGLLLGQKEIVEEAPTAPAFSLEEPEEEPEPEPKVPQEEPPKAPEKPMASPKEPPKVPPEAKYPEK